MTAAWLKPFRETRSCAFLPFALLCAIAALAPLFIWPPAQESFVLPKWTFLAGGFWFLAAAILATASGRSPLRIPFHPVNAIVAALVLWIPVSAIWTVSGPLTMFQLLQTGTAVGVVLLLQSILKDDRRALLTTSLVFCATGCIVAVWAIALDAATGFGRTGAFRAVLGDWRDAVSAAGFGNTGHVADFLALAFLVMIAHALTTGSRKVFAALAIALWLTAAALIVCWSVHSNLSLIVASAFLVGFTRKWHGIAIFRAKALRRLAVLAAGWLVVVAFYGIDHPLNPHARARWIQSVPESVEASGLPGIFGQAFSSPRWKAGGPTRLVIWLTALEAASDAPWLGHGAGTFTWVYPATPAEIVESDPELAPYARSWTNAAHNSLLQTWCELGVVGVFLLVSLVGGSIMAMYARLGREGFGNGVVLATSLAMTIALAVQSLFSFPLELPVSLVLLFVLAGIPVVLPPRRVQADLNLPVMRRFGPVEAGIVLKNMRVPTEFRFALSVPANVRFAVGGVLLLLAAALTWNSTSLLRASAAYRPAYEARSSGEPEVVIAQCRAALAIDGRLADCRSALTDQLVRAGRYEEALEELDLLQPWLNATEVHVRRAVSLQALGRTGEADRSWRVVFDRTPAFGAQYPAAFARWARNRQRQTSTGAPGS